MTELADFSVVPAAPVLRYSRPHPAKGTSGWTVSLASVPIKGIQIPRAHDRGLRSALLALVKCPSVLTLSFAPSRAVKLSSWISDLFQTSPGRSLLCLVARRKKTPSQGVEAWAGVLEFRFC